MELKNEADFAIAQGGQDWGREGEKILPIKEDLTFGWTIQGSQDMEEGAFADTRFTDNGDTLGAKECKVQPFKHPDHLLAFAIALAQSHGADQYLGHNTSLAISD
jgi:hypothetical protein